MSLNYVQHRNKRKCRRSCEGQEMLRTNQTIYDERNSGCKINIEPSLNNLSANNESASCSSKKPIRSSYQIPAIQKENTQMAKNSRYLAEQASVHSSFSAKDGMLTCKCRKYIIIKSNQNPGILKIFLK